MKILFVLLIKQIKEYKSNYSNSRYGLVSVMIGIHGTVNKDESIYFVPTYQWQNKSLKDRLSKELDIDISHSKQRKLICLC